MDLEAAQLLAIAELLVRHREAIRAVPAGDPHFDAWATREVAGIDVQLRALLTGIRLVAPNRSPLFDQAAALAARTLGEKLN